VRVSSRLLLTPLFAPSFLFVCFWFLFSRVFLQLECAAKRTARRKAKRKEKKSKAKNKSNQSNGIKIYISTNIIYYSRTHKTQTQTFKATTSKKKSSNKYNFTHSHSTLILLCVKNL